MKQFFFLLIFAFFTFQNGFSKNTDPESPVEYMNVITKANNEMNKKYMAYVSAAAHSSRKRKIEKMRLQALESINTCLSVTNDLPYYKGDNSLRKSSVDYIKLCYSIFNDDYSKIINMEEISEQSFDMMQAYILMQKKVDEKLKQANSEMQSAFKTFANKYNVTINDTQDELGEKMDEAGKINHYRNQVYLLFFKCNWQDGEIVKSMNEGKITNVEQSRSALLRYANEGLLGLDSLKSFKGDPSLANTCRRALEFYKRTAENDLPKITSYFLKKENFAKIKKAFESKGSPTKQDVENFNAAVKDLNNSMSTFNDTNNQLNQNRNSIINDWNESDKNFGDSHIPYYK